MSIKRFISISIALFILLIPNFSKAEELYTRYRLPIGTRDTSGAVVRQCYIFHEYKLLLKMDADLKAADREVAEYKLVTKLLNDKIDHLNDVVNLDMVSISMANAEILRKDKLVKDLAHKNVKLNEELTKRKRIIRITVGVGIALVGGAILGGWLVSR